MEPRERVESIKATALKEIEQAASSDELLRIRNLYLAKKSELPGLMGLLKSSPNEEKASFGKAINDAKGAIAEAYEKKNTSMEKAALADKLSKETIDLSLPGETHKVGRVNPYYEIIDEMTEIFVGMGFEVKEGRDIETDHYNFELLNVPKDHPARDMQDTFYFSDSLLLRTHTSV